MQKNEKCGDRTIWFSVDDIREHALDNNSEVGLSLATSVCVLLGNIHDV